LKSGKENSAGVKSVKQPNWIMPLKKDQARQARSKNQQAGQCDKTLVKNGWLGSEQIALNN